MCIISLSLPKPFLEKVDNYIKEQGYANRSEVVRQALRAYLTEAKQLEEVKGTVTATITIIYKQDARTKEITDKQHHFSNIVHTFLHTHVEKGGCIEVIVAKGDSQALKNFITALKTSKQVSEVKVSIL